MAKKPRKKYTPRDVRYPSLVTQMNSFLPFEKALNELLETGEVLVDENGVLIFIDGAGVKQAFTSTLRVYLDMIDIYCIRNNVDYSTKPLHILQNRMFEGMGFDEEEVDTARTCLNVCKQIIVKIKPAELLDILNTVRASMNIEHMTEESLKDPVMYLRKLKHHAGDLTYEEVQQRNNIYQRRALEEPENERVIKLRDFYVEFIATYNFYNNLQRTKV